MIKIPLTHGKTAIVDDEYAYLAELSWHALLSGNIWYAAYTTPRYADGRQHTIALHRAVLGVADPGVRVDHRNRDGLDCRRSNLRLATQSQNCCNRGASRISQSGLKGVWRVKGDRWQAQIRHHGRLYYLGLFRSATEAARAYDAKALELHGAFAYQNFPKAGGGR